MNEGLNGWKRFTSLRREAEEKQVRQDVILDRCRRRLRHSLLGRSYNQWVFYKRDRKRLRTLARRIVKQFYNNETWPALNTWKAFVVRQRSLERLMHKVIGAAAAPAFKQELEDLDHDRKKGGPLRDNNR